MIEKKTITKIYGTYRIAIYVPYKDEGYKWMYLRGYDGNGRIFHTTESINHALIFKNRKGLYNTLYDIIKRGFTTTIIEIPNMCKWDEDALKELI